MRVDERALRSRPLTPVARMTLVLLKIAAGNPRLADDLRRWVGDLRTIVRRPGGIEDFVALLAFIETVSEAPTAELDDLFTQLGPEAKEAYVTTAEMLRAEGEARGRAEALVPILTAKFGPVPQGTFDVVHAASTDQLQVWTTRALAANTLDEALR